MQWEQFSSLKTDSIHTAYENCSNFSNPAWTLIMQVKVKSYVFAAISQCEIDILSSIPNPDF